MPNFSMLNPIQKHTHTHAKHLREGLRSSWNRYNFLGSHTWTSVGTLERCYNQDEFVQTNLRRDRGVVASLECSNITVGRKRRSLDGWVLTINTMKICKPFLRLTLTPGESHGGSRPNVVP